MKTPRITTTLTTTTTTATTAAAAAGATSDDKTTGSPEKGTGKKDRAKPQEIVLPKYEDVVGKTKVSPRPAFSPRSLNRTCTQVVITQDEFVSPSDVTKSSKIHKHHHRRRRRDSRDGTLPSSRPKKSSEEKFVSLREGKSHGSSVAVIVPPHVEPSEPSLKERKSLANPSATPEVKPIHHDGNSSDSSDGDGCGTLESFLMTVLKKSSAHSNTVRSQVKILFREGVFTLIDLDDLLLDLSSDRWLRLCDSLDKRVVLACKSRAKVIASKSGGNSSS